MPVNVTTNASWSDYAATSTSSVAVATGTLNFTIEVGKAWQAADEIALVPTAARIPTMLLGTVTSYNSATGALVVSINRLESTVPSWDMVSSSTNTIGTGSKTFVTYNGKSTYFQAGDSIIAARQGTQAGNRMIGTVTSYDSANGSLVINATSTAGSGSNLTDWVFVSGGTYSNWDVVPHPGTSVTVNNGVTFTISTQPGYNVPSLISLGTGKVIVSNASTTTPIVLRFSNRARALQFENNGELQISGNWINVGTGSGLANQTVGLGDYQNIDCPAIFVETGNGTNVFRPWYVFFENTLPYGYLGTEDWPNSVVRRFGAALSQFGKSKHGNVCVFNTSNRILTFGDGTNGNVIPSGARVRIPNIHLTCDYPRTVLSQSIASGEAVTMTKTLGKGGNLTSGTGSIYILNGEEFLGTVTSNSISLTARAQNGTSAAAHAQGDTIFGLMVGNGTTNTNRALFDSADGGKISLSKVSLGGVYLNIQNPQACSLTDVFISGAAAIGSTTSPVNVNGLYSSPWPGNDSSSTVNIASVLGPLDAQHVYVAAYTANTASTTNILQISSNQNVVRLENCEGLCTPRLQGTPTGFYFNACVMASDVVLKNITTIGCRMNFNASANFEADGIEHSDQSTGTATSALPLDGLTVTNCQNVVVRNMTVAADGAACRNAPVRTDANCKNVVFHSLNYQGQNNAGQFVFNGNDIKLSHSNFGAVRDVASASTGSFGMTNSGTGDTVTVQKVTFTPPVSYAVDKGLGLCARAYYEYVTAPSIFWRSGANSFAGNYQEFGPFHVLTDVGNATGTLYASFGVEATRDIYDFGGTAYAGNNGRIYLLESGDSVVVKSYQQLRSITGFGATEPALEAVGSYSSEFKLFSYGSAVPASWTELTAANLQSAFGALTDYDSNVGVGLHLRITATASSASNQLINVRLFTTNDAAFNPPVGYASYTFSGLPAGSVLAAFDGSTEEAYVSGLSGAGTLPLPYDYDGLDKTVAVKVRSYLGTWDDHSLTHRQFAVARVTSAVLDDQVTEPDESVVGAYTDLGSTAKVYDYFKYWGSRRANLLQPSLLTKSGGVLDFGNYNVVIDADAAEVFAFDGSTVTVKTGNLSAGELTTAGTLTVANGALVEIPFTASNGSQVALTLSGPVVGSRVQVYDVANDVEVANFVYSGPYSTLVGYSGDATLRVRAAYVSGATAKASLEVTGQLTSGGASFLLSQENDAVYNLNAIDGSAVTEFSADYPNIEVDVDDGDGTTAVQRIYAWWKFNETTEDGIANFFNGITADDAVNYRIRTALVDVKLDNQSAEPCVIGGGRIYRDDGASVIASGSNSLQIDPDKVYALATSAAPTVAEIRAEMDSNSTKLAAIDANAKTAVALSA